jgi:hypothetical protein
VSNVRRSVLKGRSPVIRTEKCSKKNQLKKKIFGKIQKP